MVSEIEKGKHMALCRKWEDQDVGSSIAAAAGAPHFHGGTDRGEERDGFGCVVCLV